MRIRVDREKCISAASCVAIAPDTFELDEEGKAVIKSKDGKKTSDWTDYKNLSEAEQIILDAAKSCPTEAIIIEDDNGKQIFP